MDRVPDPYRELGVLRGASDVQIKAAHRRLAKRFHPDAPEGDTDRFLAVQAAYSLLSDALRRKEWDAAHAPVRAGDPGRPRGRGPAAGRWARESGASGVRRGGGAATGGARPAGPKGGQTRGAGAGPARRGPGDAAAPDDRGPREGVWSAGDRDPASRSTTWSAGGVPWWEDFSPRDRGAGSAGAGSAGAGSAGPGGPRPGARPGTSGGGSRPGGGPGGGRPGTAPNATGGAARGPGGRSPDEFDVYNRSSGAAWSMAARRYFRKGEAELPKGGAWRYRGTQVVTGAEARKVAEEEAARQRAADALLRSRAAGPAPSRTAFEHPPEPTRQPSPAPRARPAAPSSPGPTSPPSRSAPSGASRPSGGTAAPVPSGSLLRRVRKALGLG